MTAEYNKTFYVMIGTIAEFIKLAPVIIELRARGAEVIPIATGQNDIAKSDLYNMVFPEGVKHWVTRRTIKQTPIHFAIWAIECFFRAFFKFQQVFKAKPGDEKVQLLVHGDTVRTFIGGFTSWCAGADVVHVEAGLRSFNLLRPFPEEFCRIFVSIFARRAFCPGTWACGNLLSSKRHKKMVIVNTIENTLLDAMRMALTYNLSPQVANKRVHSTNAITYRCVDYLWSCNFKRNTH